MSAGRGGNGNVFEIDEAGSLEAREDGFGCLELLGVVAMQEFGEVNELWMSEMGVCTRLWVSLPGSEAHRPAQPPSPYFFRLSCLQSLGSLLLPGAS